MLPKLHLTSESPVVSSPPTTACLINNYNYASFVVQAVHSAMSQTVPFDEVIVVDDGSTDDSLARLKSEFAGDSKVRIIAKENHGQLSSFNAGFAACHSELVCLLDADDLYEPGWLEAVQKAFQAPDRDFVFCQARQFGAASGLMTRGRQNIDWGRTRELVRGRRLWIGSPTSCLAVRRATLAKILPLPLEPDWRIRADDCLVFGASFCGAHKHYLAEPWVRYRVHEQNGHFGRKASAAERRAHGFRFNRLMNWFEQRWPLADNPLEAIEAEFLSHPRPSSRVLMRYAKLVAKCPGRWAHKAETMCRLTMRHFGRSASPSARTGTRPNAA